MAADNGTFWLSKLGNQLKIALSTIPKLPALNFCCLMLLLHLCYSFLFPNEFHKLAVAAEKCDVVGRDLSKRKKWPIGILRESNENSYKIKVTGKSVKLGDGEGF